MAENVWQVAYCHEHMLAVWERWTDGNMAARRLIENRGGDAQSRGSLFRQLGAAVRALQPGDNFSAGRAARAAAAACFQACIDSPAADFERACRQARVADIAARKKLAS